METGRGWWRILESQSLRQRNGCGEKEKKRKKRQERRCRRGGGRKELETGCDGEKMRMSCERGTDEKAASPTSGRSRQVPGERQRVRKPEKAGARNRQECSKNSR